VDTLKALRERLAPNMPTIRAAQRLFGAVYTPTTVELGVLDRLAISSEEIDEAAAAIEDRDPGIERDIEELVERLPAAIVDDQASKSVSDGIVKDIVARWDATPRGRRWLSLAMSRIVDLPEVDDLLRRRTEAPPPPDRHAGPVSALVGDSHDAAKLTLSSVPHPPRRSWLERRETTIREALDEHGRHAMKSNGALATYLRRECAPLEKGKNKYPPRQIAALICKWDQLQDDRKAKKLA
jgi:hypothetical protein